MILDWELWELYGDNYEIIRIGERLFWVYNKNFKVYERNIILRMLIKLIFILDKSVWNCLIKILKLIYLSM